jgi:hypothetical protein
MLVVVDLVVRCGLGQSTSMDMVRKFLLVVAELAHVSVGTAAA